MCKSWDLIYDPIKNIGSRGRVWKVLMEEVSFEVPSLKR